MQQVTGQQNPTIDESIEAALNSRMQLLLRGFSEREAAGLGFMRWLVEESVIGGARDGAALAQ